ncbi:MAG: helix-turn-helix domain-containing protein [Bacteroidota bacterium]
MPAKIYHIDLSEKERKELEEFVTKRKATTQKWKRSKILLAADRGGEKRWDDGQIAKQYEVSTRTIERLRQRYVLEGLEVALNGKPRLNLDKKKFDGQVEAQLIALRCSEPKLGRSSWTLRLLAEEMVALEYVVEISHESVRQILKKMKLSLGE